MHLFVINTTLFVTGKYISGFCIWRRAL